MYIWIKKRLPLLVDLLLGGKTGDYSPEFMNSMLKSPKVRKEITSKAQGAQHINVGQEILENVSVILLVIKEQERIAEFLSSIDDIIQVQEEEIFALEEQKKGAMQKLFNRDVRFKAYDGSEYPEWEEKGLEQIANIFDGTHQTPEYVNEGIPFVSVEDINNLYGTNKYITEEAFNKEFKIYPQQGDILMTRTGSIGVAAIITKDIKMAYYVSLTLLKLKEKVNTAYLLQYILCEKFQQELWKRTLHIAFPKKINKNEIGKCKVSIPCLEEQKKITTYILRSFVIQKCVYREVYASDLEGSKCFEWSCLCYYRKKHGRDLRVLPA